MSDPNAIIEPHQEKEAPMNEEVEIGTFTPNTHPVLQALNEKVSKLENDLSITSAERDATKNENNFINTKLTNAVDKYRRAEYALTDLLKEMISEEDITIENAQKIADIFDSVTLSKRVTIRYDLVSTVEFEVPLGKDIDEVTYNAYCDVVRFDTYDSDIEVLECDFDICGYTVIS